MEDSFGITSRHRPQRILGGSVVGCPLKGRGKAWPMEGHYRVSSLFSGLQSPGAPLAWTEPILTNLCQHSSSSLGWLSKLTGEGFFDCGWGLFGKRKGTLHSGFLFVTGGEGVPLDCCAKRPPPSQFGKEGEIGCLLHHQVIQDWVLGKFI